MKTKKLLLICLLSLCPVVLGDESRVVIPPDPDFATMTNLGKAIIRKSDKISIILITEGKWIDFQGAGLSKIIKILDPILRERWSVDSSIIDRRKADAPNTWSYFIRCSAFKSGSTTKFDLLAQFPLNFGNLQNREALEGFKKQIESMPLGDGVSKGEDDEEE